MRDLDLTSSSAVPAAREAGWLKYAALVTGVFSALAGFLTFRSVHLANDAVYYSNRAVLYRAEASDTWAEYQADSVKARVVETALAAGVADPAAREQLAGQAQDFRARQPPLKDQAEGLERQRDAEVARSQRRLADKDVLAYAGLAVQVGIGLASVAALTRWAEALVIGVLVGLVGLGVAAVTLLRTL